MKLQHQTTFGGADAPPEEQGNCYATCIASLLGVDASRVPNFVTHGDDTYFEETSSWLAQRGLALMAFANNPVCDVPEWRDRVTMIASGPGPRGHEHAVLWRGGRLLHDPHPSGDGLVSEPDCFELLVVIDPDGLRRLLEESAAGPEPRCVCDEHAAFIHPDCPQHGEP